MQLAPKLPNEFSAALRFNTATSVTTGGSVLSKNGLCEFLNNVPGFALQMFQLYKYCRVTAVDAHFEVQNMSTNTDVVNVVLATIPSSDTSTVTWAIASNTPGAINKTVGPSSGTSRAVFRKRYNPMAILGQNIKSLNYAMTVSQATATTPLDPQEPQLCLVMLSTLSVTWQLSLLIDIVYHCQFFDLYADNA